MVLIKNKIKMSSTNRGYDRHKSDYYVTPQKDIEEFMYHLQYTVLNKDTASMEKLDWLDPCCGGDSENEASYISVINRFFNPDKICGIDIREDSKADIIMNYLDCEKENMSNHDIIISNPPFYLAEDFIKKSLEFVNDHGYVVMLLRLNFFGSKKRKQLFENNMPEYCFVHHKRISFMKGATDSIEYAHFVWKKGVNNDYCKTYVI
jgi:hypothetical protein